MTTAWVGEGVAVLDNHYNPQATDIQPNARKMLNPKGQKPDLQIGKVTIRQLELVRTAAHPQSLL